MPMITCSNCSKETSSAYNFCQHCEKQVVCLNPNCQSPIVAGKSICLVCGQSLVQLSVQPQINKFVRHIKQEGRNYEEDIEINMTDQAVGELAPFITGQIIPTNSRHEDQASRINRRPEKQIQPALFDKTEEPNQVYSEPSRIPFEVTNEQQNNSDGAANYFEVDGQQLVVKVKDFKGSTWKEQQRRFILLYTAAYTHYFQKPVPLDKDFYKKAAEKAHVYDYHHFGSYLTNVTKEMFLTLSEGYKLNPKGEEEVKTIIKEMNNETTKCGDQYWERSISPPPKPTRLTKDDINKIKSWSDEDVNLGKLKITDVSSPLDYLLIALWIITVHLKKEKAIRWGDAYRYLIEKYTTISSNSDAFRKASISATSNQYTAKNGDLLYLNSEGIKKVEKMISGESKKS